MDTQPILRTITGLILLLLMTIGCHSKSRIESSTLQHNNKEVVCFIYHRFDDSRYPTTNTSTRDFEAHLKYLTSEGFELVTFADAVRYLQSDKPVKKVACITIDDAFSSFYKNGFPLLKKFNVPATLFINTKTVGGGDYMTWEQLADCTRNKLEIGNHTHSHDYFLNLPAATRYKTFRDEITLSQSLIEKHFGHKPTVFSFPYGEFDDEMKSIVKDAGFIAAAAQNSGVMHSNGDFFQLPRFPMSEAYSAQKKFIGKAETHALVIDASAPSNAIVPANGIPKLTLTVSGENLQLKKMQCFVQGSTCRFTIDDMQKKIVTIQATSSILKRRRTLYTITMQDKEGKWYWYSHLWVNPRVR